MSWCAAGGAGGGAELGAGLARVGGLEDFAAAARCRVVAGRSARAGAARAVGQGFRAVHFVEVGFVDAGGTTATTRGLPLTPTPRSSRRQALSPRRAGRGRRGTAA